MSTQARIPTWALLFAALLLAAIYSDLYGGERPYRDEAEEDLRDLRDCLRGGRSAEAICERFGRSVVGNRLFYDAHRDLIDDIERGDRRGDRRRRF